MFHCLPVGGQGAPDVHVDPEPSPGVWPFPGRPAGGVRTTHQATLSLSKYKDAFTLLIARLPTALL